MHVRPLTRADLPGVATVFCEAFADDNLTKFRLPHRYEYPLAWRAVAIAKQHTMLTRPGAWGLVCVSDAADRDSTLPEGTVVGYCWWARFPTARTIATDPWMQNHTSLVDTLERTLRSLEAWYEETVCPNPAFDPEHRAIIDHMMAGQKKKQQPLRGLVPHWHLAALAVLPAFQGRGAGRMLLQWGLDRIAEEWDATTDEMRRDRHVAKVATLNASQSGAILYRKYGFEKVGDDDASPHVLVVPGAEQPDWPMVFDPLRTFTRESAVGADGTKRDHVVWTVNAVPDQKGLVSLTGGESVDTKTAMG